MNKCEPIHVGDMIYVSEIMNNRTYVRMTPVYVR